VDGFGVAGANSEIGVGDATRVTPVIPESDVSFASALGPESDPSIAVLPFTLPERLVVLFLDSVRARRGLTPTPPLLALALVFEELVFGDAAADDFDEFAVDEGAVWAAKGTGAAVDCSWVDGVTVGAWVFVDGAEDECFGITTDTLLVEELEGGAFSITGDRDSDSDLTSLEAFCNEVSTDVFRFDCDRVETPVFVEDSVPAVPFTGFGGPILITREPSAFGRVAAGV